LATQYLATNTTSQNRASNSSPTSSPPANAINMISALKCKFFYILLCLFTLFATWTVHGNTIDPAPWLANVNAATISTTESNFYLNPVHPSLYRRSESTNQSTSTNKPVDKARRIEFIRLYLLMGGISVIFCVSYFCIGVFRRTKDYVRLLRHRRAYQKRVRLNSFRYENYP
jgi:hypothetical protein